ncbi:CRISPR system Cascade subunit CasA [Murinocardiopsis flavida]|uniref:CRISPR system Cascade subunit CasA n=1 Tax=Murinocardiopsis flavida TaxID=645275 RepID=A0A2P8CWT2_9ACTN|nr:type I-E CRISPR-associated protein Cse1/CasA [Murinocardiopsis flavida]PSK89410.1 CRISPR system Cascade subunit CasA [Murinocardiopsis flavida]
MLSFSLLRQQWIPVVTLDGDPDLLGIEDVFGRAHELRCVRAEAPIVTAALYRMLLAFAHRIYDGPRSLEEWSRLWEAREFEKEPLDKYWQDHPDAFELLGGDRPFMQCPGLSTVEPKSAAQLLLYRARGNNTTLFDHTTDGERPDLPADVAARWLVTVQSFDTGGTKTPYEKKKSSKSGLCNHFATVILEGDNLKETLLLNMVLYAPDLGLPLPTTTAEDHPIWERNQPPGPEPVEEGQFPKGWTDLLTWPSRRILLHGRDTEDGVLVDGTVIAPGTQFGAELQQIEAMAAFQKPNKKEVFYPVRLEILRGVWRHAAELLLPTAGLGVRLRPLSIENIAELVDNTLPADKVITLRVFGQKLMSNPGAVEYWSEEALPVKLALLRAQNIDWMLELLFGYAVRLADEVGAALQQMTKNYSNELRGDFDQYKHWSYLAERYWPRLDAEFAQLLRNVGDVVQTYRHDDREGRARLKEHFEKWQAHVDGTAREAVQTWVDEFPRVVPRQLFAMASTEMIFLGALKKLNEKYTHDVDQRTR